MRHADKRNQAKHYIQQPLFSIQYLKQARSSSMSKAHAHSEYELYYLLSGERVYFMHDRLYNVKKGNLMIIHPRDQHATFSSEQQQFERVLINFSSGFIESGDLDVAKMLQFLPSGMLSVPATEQDEIESLLLSMLNECEQREDHHASYVRAQLTQLLIHLHRIHKKSTAPVQSDEQHPLYERIMEITSYIRSHYTQKITLDEVAKHFFISPSHLSRIFKKLTGFHFQAYVQVIRVREAKKRLINSKQSVQAIAEQAGFGHISHFNKTFKKITGTTPLQYRKSNTQVSQTEGRT